MTDSVKITARDPYEDATIDRESFIKKYGKAAEKFINEIEQASYRQAIEDIRKAIPKKREYGSFDTKTVIEQIKTENRIIDAILKGIESSISN